MITVTAWLNLLSLYDHYFFSLLLRSNPKLKLPIPPSSHTRYTNAWSDTDARYRWSMRFLGVIRSLELVFEMTLHRKVSDKMRWRGVWVLELIKCVSSALCRVTKW